MVGAETNANTAATRADIRLGAWLDDFAEFDAAFAAGDLTRDHVDLLRRSADNSRTRGALLRDQHIFIDAGRDCSFRQFEEILGYWINANDPDGEEPADQIANSTVTARRRADGTVKISGTLDPLQGEALINALNLEADKLQRSDDRTDQIRPTAKRHADALVSLVTRGHNNPDGTSTPRVLMHIVMSETIAEQTLRRLDNPFADIDLNHSSVDGRCEFADGTPLHPNLALATLGVAELRRVVLGAKSRALDVSHAARSFPQWMKDALIVESRGKCVTRGCTAPLNWLQGDHIKPHSKHGRTRLDNGESRCSGCNKHKSDTWDGQQVRHDLE